MHAVASRIAHPWRAMTPSSTMDAPIRTTEEFHRYFQEEITEIQERILNIDDLSLVGGERQDALDHCQVAIRRVSDEVVDALHSLPAYDQRTYAAALKALSEKLHEARQRCQPKSKFQFRTAKNESAISLSDAAEMASLRRKQQAKHSFRTSAESSLATTPAHLISPPNELEHAESQRPAGPATTLSRSQGTTITDQTNAHVVIASFKGNASSATVTKIRNSVIDMTAASREHHSAGLACRNVKNSVILLGRVDGAVHLTGLENTVVVVAARQVRIHECRNVDIYLRSRSRPIIEDCSGMRFAPLPEVLDQELQDTSLNQWDQVDDFKWLKFEPSPNWTVLAETHRISATIWQDDAMYDERTPPDVILERFGLSA